MKPQPSTSVMRADDVLQFERDLVQTAQCLSRSLRKSQKTDTSQDAVSGATLETSPQSVSSALAGLAAVIPKKWHAASRQAFDLFSTSQVETFKSLARWEGTVLAVEDDHMLARLIDLEGATADLEAEILLDEISPADLLRVEEGAIFYWTVGYLDTTGGQRKRESIIRFRSLPRWREKDIERSKKAAASIREELDWQ